MNSVVVFVDAGYLFAQGSTALTGDSVPRSRLKLNETAVTAELKKIALEKGIGCRLLRIYWYDGAPSGRLSMDQVALANSDDIKLRLGQINSIGQQKGVDSLIVTDLIELARNRAVSDALLMAGDEDVRIGVQIAQSFGVRVHLLGIEAGRSSQSPLLMQEADTTSMWGKAELEKFLTITAPSTPMLVAAKLASSSLTLDEISASTVASLSDEQIVSFAEFRKTSSSIPPEFDGRLLAKAREGMGRDLDQKEKRNLRSHFVSAVKLRRPTLFP